MPIKVVVLDINKRDDRFNQFDDSSFIHQVDVLTKSIENICEELKYSAPDDPWILTWREYGITDPKFGFVSVDNKRLFREALHQLSKKYSPNLTIVAGTIATSRITTDPNILDKLDSYYNEHIWVKESENHLLDRNKHFLKEEIKRNKLRSKKEKIKDYRIIRNTCYCFNGDIVTRHDKVTPFNESKDPNEEKHIIRFDKLNLADNDAPIRAPFALFKPGKGRSLSSLIMIKHPSTNEDITLGVEICREHARGMLKHRNEKPFIQFILSDTVAPMPLHFVSDYVIHADSDYKPRLFTTRAGANVLPVEYYQYNLLDPHADLIGPLKPETPFEMRIVNLLTEEINRSTTSTSEKNSLTSLLQNFSHLISATNDIISIVNKIKSSITKLRIDFKDSKHLETFFAAVDSLICEQENQFHSTSSLHNLFDALPWQPDPVDFFFAILEDSSTKALDHYNKYKLWKLIELQPSQILVLLEGISDSNKSKDEKEAAYISLYKQTVYALDDTSDPKLGGECIIHKLCRQINNPDAIQTLATISDINWNVKSENKGETPLQIALKEGQDVEVIDALLENGSDPTIKNNKGYTALDYTDEEDFDIVKLIEDKMVKMNMTKKQ